MKKILIFSDKQGLDGGNYNFFEEDFMENSSYPILLNFNGITNIFDDSDIIILEDKDFFANITIDEEFLEEKQNELSLEIIRKILSDRVDILIVYHDTDNIKNYPEFFKDKLQIKQSHISGSIYDIELNEIAQSIKNKNKETYSKAIDKLYKRFPDSILDTILNFLHNCLLPEDAQKQEFPIKLKLTKNGVIYSEAFEIFKKIANKYKNNQAFDPNYIKALSDLRDELLKDY